MSDLPPKLAAVLARLLEKNPGLSKAHLATLPYLVDVVAMRVLGRPITDAEHICISDAEYEALIGNCGFPLA